MAVMPKIECRQYHAGLRVPDIREAVVYYTTQIG